MLTENESSLVWRNSFEAEIRSLYFAQQAVRYTKYKQVITGISFFASSGAAVTLFSSAPRWVPAALSVIVAVLAAYSMSVSLDRRIGAICKLHSEWNHLNSEYENLWEHWYEERAKDTLTNLLKRGREASQIALEMPYDAKAMDKWEKVVDTQLKGESR